MRVSRTTATVLLLLTLSLPGRGPAHAQGATEPPTTLRFGVMVEKPAQPDRIIRAFEGLLSLLRERLGPSGLRVADVVIAADVEDLSHRLRVGEVDLVIETVFASQLLQERSGALEPSLALVRDGQREYRSVFFTRKDSPIEGLGDLRRRTLVLEAPRSTSAFALPIAALARRGISTVSDAAGGDGGEVRYVLAGGEINQAVWVAHGRGDAAAFNERDWEGLPPRIREQLRIFHRTDTVLRGLLSFRADYDAGARAQVEDLLIGLHEDPDAREALAQARITRFERLGAGDRANLRRWAEAFRAVALAP